MGRLHTESQIDRMKIQLSKEKKVAFSHGESWNIEKFLLEMCFSFERRVRIHGQLTFWKFAIFVPESGTGMEIFFPYSLGYGEAAY